MKRLDETPLSHLGNSVIVSYDTVIGLKHPENTYWNMIIGVWGVSLVFVYLIVSIWNNYLAKCRPIVSIWTDLVSFQTVKF